jgi:hypothetical protein
MRSPIIPRLKPKKDAVDKDRAPDDPGVALSGGSESSEGSADGALVKALPYKIASIKVSADLNGRPQD